MLTASVHTEKFLFGKISLGDENAFREIFYLYNKALYPFILSLVKSEPDAREIIQEIFLKIWENRTKLNQIQNPGGWIFKVAANTAYSYLRKEARYVLRQTKNIQQENSNDPFIQLDDREAHLLISEAIKKLPLRRRQVFQLSRIEGYTRKEIAEHLHISENTVRNQLVDAVTFIQDFLRKKGFILHTALMILAICHD